MHWHLRRPAVWALTIRADPVRDTMMVENTPHRLPGLRLAREWPRQQDGVGCHEQVARRDATRVGRSIGMDAQVQARMDSIFDGLGL